MHPLPILINYNIFCGSLALAESRVHMTPKALPPAMINHHNILCCSLALAESRVQMASTAQRLLRSLRLVLAREKSYNVSEAEGRSKHAKERTIKNRYLYVVFIWIFLINTQCYFTSFSIWNEVFFSFFCIFITEYFLFV